MWSHNIYQFSILLKQCFMSNFVSSYIFTSNNANNKIIAYSTVTNERARLCQIPTKIQSVIPNSISNPIESKMLNTGPIRKNILNFGLSLVGIEFCINCILLIPFVTSWCTVFFKMCWKIAMHIEKIMMKSRTCNRTEKLSLL